VQQVVTCAFASASIQPTHSPQVYHRLQHSQQQPAPLPTPLPAPLPTLGLTCRVVIRGRVAGRRCHGLQPLVRPAAADCTFFSGDVSSAVAVSHCMSRASTALNTSAHASSSGSSPASACIGLDSDAHQADSPPSLGGVSGAGDAVLTPIALPALPPSWCLSHSACVARSCRPAASVLAWVRLSPLFVVLPHSRRHNFVLGGECTLGSCRV
jgi:hypothetical protein